jgi:hypothetical protein
LKDVMFRNESSGEVKNISEAVEPPAELVCNGDNEGDKYYGWFGDCLCLGEDGWDCTANFYYWNSTLFGGSFVSISYDDPTYELKSWVGYFAKFNNRIKITFFE